MRHMIIAAAAVLALAGCDTASVAQRAVKPANIADSAKPSITERAVAALPGTPPARTDIPQMRWGDRKGGDAWTREVLATLEADGVGLTSALPRDVASFCPNYVAQPPDGRRAFWAGLLSSLAKHESGWNQAAKGGGGRWLGLMQISPATWRHYGCDGEILEGGDNLSCAAKIMAKNVVRDNAIAGGSSGWRGVARDWSPMRSAAKRADIAAWTRSQPYCTNG